MRTLNGSVTHDEFYGKKYKLNGHMCTPINKHVHFC